MTQFTPASDYDGLLRQAKAQDRIIKSLQRRVELYHEDYQVMANKLLLVNFEALQAERETNAMLTEQLEKVEAEKSRLSDALLAAISALDTAEEINPSNYDHDLVCGMNRAYCEAYGILREEVKS